MLVGGLLFCLSLLPVHAAAPSSTLSEILSQAHALRVGGNYPAAISLYQQIIDQAGNPPASDDLPLARTALYAQAQTYALDMNYAQAAETWQKFLDHASDDPRRALALLQQANALRQQKNFVAAFIAYQAYRAVVGDDDPLTPYVALMLGDGYRDAGQYALAADEYRRVQRATDTMPTMRALAAQRLGDSLVKMGDYAAAVQAYDLALQQAKTANTRSQVEVAAGRALKELGKNDEAIARFKHVLSNATDGDAAPQAVQELQALSPKELNYYLAGLAYYYRKQYATAVDWFHRFLNEQGDLDLAHYYAAKAYEFSNQQDRAIREWTVLIDTHKDSGKLAEAWFERADDYHRIGQDATAIKQYQQLAALYPNSKFAEDGQFAIASIYEQAGQFAEAAKQYETIQANNPGGARAAEALTAAGMARYRLNDLAGARTTFEKLLTSYLGSASKAKGLFWLGKILDKQGLKNEAKTRWLQAYAAKPDDYYSLRALDMAQGTLPSGVGRQGYELPTSFPGEQRVMERWLQSWVAAPDVDELAPRHQAGSLASLWPELASDARLRRGKLLLEVGMKSEARAELNSLADQYKNDPRAQYQLGIVFNALGLYDMLIRAGYRIFLVSPLNNLNEAPEYLQRMIYPVPFSQLIVSEAQKYHLDPLLFFALVWQESQFDPAISSSAGARGLGQVMPSTGSYIANVLKRANYKADDLFKPYVSIEFGAYYLGRALQDLGGDYMMALAGYNGGPGNAAKWQNADVDVAVENIRLQESRTYVRRVYQHYWFYRHLYGGERL